MDKCRFCDKEARARGLCVKHYQEERRYGRLNNYDKKKTVSVEPYSTQNNNITTNCVDGLVKDMRIRKSVTTNRIPTIGDILNELSDTCGISQETARAIKDRHVTPSLSVAVKIARYFGKNVEDVFFVD